MKAITLENLIAIGDILVQQPFHEVKGILDQMGPLTEEGADTVTIGETEAVEIPAELAESLIDYLGNKLTYVQGAGLLNPLLIDHEDDSLKGKAEDIMQEAASDVGVELNDE